MAKKKVLSSFTVSKMEDGSIEVGFSNYAKWNQAQIERTLGLVQAEWHQQRAVELRKHRQEMAAAAERDKQLEMGV